MFHFKANTHLVEISLVVVEMASKIIILNAGHFIEVGRRRLDMQCFSSQLIRMQSERLFLLVMGMVEEDGSVITSLLLLYYLLKQKERFT